MEAFLSLGFSGRSENEVIDEIDRAKKLIASIYNDYNFEFIHNYDYNGINRVDCLGEAIKKMSKCNYVFFINDWHRHNGCIIEKRVCELYNIPHEEIKV